MILRRNKKFLSECTYEINKKMMFFSFYFYPFSRFFTKKYFLLQFQTWNMECRKERVLSMAHLEDLHVSGYEVPQVLPDQIELVHVRLARPQSLALHQLHVDTTWETGT